MHVFWLYFIVGALKKPNGGEHEEVEEEDEYPIAVESEQDPSETGGEVPGETVVHGLVQKGKKRRSKCGHNKENMRLKQNTNGGEAETTHWQEQGE